MPNKNILVPVGFSDQSLIALGQAVNLAKKMNAKITLLAVVEESNTLFGLFGEDKDALKEHTQKIRKNLEGLAEEYSKSGVEFDVLTASGVVYEEISRAATNIDAKFIVMGTDGRPGNISKRFIGSNAYRTVTSAPCPVITIKGSEHREGLERIVLPLDLEKETKQKVNHCIALAKLFNAEVHIISVLTSDDEFLRNTLKRNIRSVETFIKGKSVKCVAKLVSPEKGQDLSRAVIQYGKEIDADLIMIMTQEENQITEFFLGSAAQSIIYHSRMPVMSIRPKSKDVVYDLP